MKKNLGAIWLKWHAYVLGEHTISMKNELYLERLLNTIPTRLVIAFPVYHTR